MTAKKKATHIGSPFLVVSTHVLAQIKNHLNWDSVTPGSYALI